MKSTPHLADLAHSKPLRPSMGIRGAALLLLLAACSAGNSDDTTAQASSKLSAEDIPMVALEPALDLEAAGLDEHDAEPMGAVDPMPRVTEMTEWFELDTSTLGEADGLAFSIGLPEVFESLSSDSEHPQRSTLVLEEDGEQIGPGNALHQSIREDGEGAFSHWGNRLMFSTSDNSDPRTNGRVYRVRFE